MGPIDWPAVIVSAFMALGIGLLWYGPLFEGADLFGRVGSGRRSMAAIGGAVAFQAISALMMGHSFARLGAEKLAAKPWLFWMQSGGFALAFIIPALWISYTHHRIARRDAVIDAAFWLAVYLASGTVFWMLR